MYLERLGCGKSQANSHISRDRCPKSPPRICQNTRLQMLTAGRKAPKWPKLAQKRCRYLQIPYLCVVNWFNCVLIPSLVIWAALRDQKGSILADKTALADPSQLRFIIVDRMNLLHGPKQVFNFCSSSKIYASQIIHCHLPPRWT